MALIDALNDIVSDMEALKDPVVMTYAKMLRIAIKSNEQPKFEKPNWAKEAQEEFRSKKNVNKEKSGVEESFGGGLCLIVNGPLGSQDETPNYFAVPPGGKLGQKIVLEGDYVYMLAEDSKLLFVEDDTRQLIEIKKKKNSESSPIILGSG